MKILFVFLLVLSSAIEAQKNQIIKFSEARAGIIFKKQVKDDFYNIVVPFQVQLLCKKK